MEEAKAAFELEKSKKKGKKGVEEEADLSKVKILFKV